MRRRPSLYSGPSSPANKWMLLKIAYFVNEYPKVSHSFIRREILALEAQGFFIQRIALRGWNGPLPDAADREERDRTSMF